MGVTEIWLTEEGLHVKNYSEIGLNVRVLTEIRSVAQSSMPSLHLCQQFMLPLISFCIVTSSLCARAVLPALTLGTLLRESVAHLQV